MMAGVERDPVTAGTGHKPLRPPSQVMRLHRMGAFFPTRLSFMRVLLRRLHREGAIVSRPVWDIDDEGYGTAVYTVPLGGRPYSLVAFSDRLAPEDRTDRVIAEAWDTTFALYDGVPGPQDLKRLQAAVPKQEAGRCSARELVLSRANKSVRLFAHVADRLAAGRKPDLEEVRSVGYLMRTTAVYGNGKFGIADRAGIADRPGLSEPFQAEMLTVWLIRGFTLDLVEHVARSRSPETAVDLDPLYRRYLGVGNSTGLGMAPFLVNHPVLINNWMLARETALARVRDLPEASGEAVERFLTLFARARQHISEWNVDDERQQRRIEVLRRDLSALEPQLSKDTLSGDYPWDRVVWLAELRSIECAELMVALVLEPYGDLIDGLAHCMSSDTACRVDPGMTIGRLGEIVAGSFAWALAIDFSAPDAEALFWYVSENKAEPRLGRRHDEPGADKEAPLDIARRVQVLSLALKDWPPDELVAALLLRRPDLRYIVRRVQSAERYPYGEIQNNLLDAECLPIDLLRCKLSFFGASKFDPKSDRWTRITLFQGAPGLDEISTTEPDDWCFPVLGGSQ